MQGLARDPSADFKPAAIAQEIRELLQALGCPRAGAFMLREGVRRRPTLRLPEPRELVGAAAFDLLLQNVGKEPGTLAVQSIAVVAIPVLALAGDFRRDLAQMGRERAPSLRAKSEVLTTFVFGRDSVDIHSHRFQSSLVIGTSVTPR